MAAFDIQNLVSGGLLKLNNEISASVENPTVQLYPVDALKVQVDNDPNNDVLLTELVACISAKKIDTTTFLLESEYMYLTGGTEKTVSGRDVVEYTATVRGLFNAHANNPPTSADGGDRNWKAHDPQSTCAIPEDYLIRYMDAIFSNTTNVFNRPLEAAQGTVSAGTVVSLNSSGEFIKGWTSGQAYYITTQEATAPANIDAARYFASGFTPPGSIGDVLYGTYTNGTISATGGAGKEKIGSHAIDSDDTAGVSIIPEGQEVELSQAQVENSSSTDFGSVSGQRLYQALVAGLGNTLDDFDRMFGDGSDGALDTTSAEVDINLDTVYQYSSMVIHTNALTTSQTNGVMIIRCQGNCTISDSGLINLAGKGAAGGAAVTETSTSQNGNDGTTASTDWIIDGVNHYGNKGIGTRNGSQAAASGGSGAGCIAAGTASSDAVAAPLTATGAVAGAIIDAGIQAMAFIKALVGSGGGSGGAAVNGGSSPSVTSGAGGAGGAGLILLVGGNLTLSTATSIDASGVNGSAATGNATGNSMAGGGGGGGAGGGVLVLVKGTITGDTSKIKITGGSGGSGYSYTWSFTGTGTAGGAGSAGLKVLQNLFQ